MMPTKVGCLFSGSLRAAAAGGVDGARAGGDHSQRFDGDQTIAFAVSVIHLHRDSK